MDPGFLGQQIDNGRGMLRHPTFFYMIGSALNHEAECGQGLITLLSVSSPSTHDLLRARDQKVEARRNMKGRTRELIPDS